MNNKIFFKDMPKPNFDFNQSRENETVSLENFTNETFRKQEIDTSAPAGALKMNLWDEHCEKSLPNDVTWIFFPNSNLMLEVGHVI